MMRKQKGQSMAEYAVVLGVVVAAVVAMQVYVGRSFKAKIKDTTDLAIDHVDAFVKGEGGKTATKQYEPYYVNSGYQVTQDQQHTETVDDTKGVTATLTKDQTTRTGSSTTDVDQSKDDAWQ